MDSFLTFFFSILKDYEMFRTKSEENFLTSRRLPVSRWRMRSVEIIYAND